ncbi:MAG: hypothetical protein D6770_00855 [Anaerolineae bacterium]|nr:MAG: hypothetical protein D6770_00855 [Anaerolineae bacterium]
MNRPAWLTPWTVFGAFLVAALLTLLSLIRFGWWYPPSAPDPGVVLAALTVIPAPTSTPRLVPTPTLDPLLVNTPTPRPGEIVIGGYVQIVGTEGEGLRLRAAPGLGAAPLFLGFDAEVFQVRDGPQVADGYTWWYLVAIYDETRAGWAAADFLEAIPSP